MGFLSSMFGGGSSVDEARVKAVVAAGGRILDVRGPDEFGGGHVEGALNIPVQVLAGRLSEVGPKDQPVIVYCRSGGRSAQATSILKGAGWTEVIDVGPMSAFPR